MPLLFRVVFCHCFIIVLPSVWSVILSQHGGKTNAFTSSQQTNYHFDVNTDAFEEALDRWILLSWFPTFLISHDNFLTEYHGLFADLPNSSLNLWCPLMLPQGKLKLLTLVRHHFTTLSYVSSFPCYLLIFVHFLARCHRKPKELIIWCVENEPGNYSCHCEFL